MDCSLYIHDASCGISKKKLLSWIEDILSTTKKMNCGLSVSLVGPRKIKELNRKYRHKDSVTDVLSFPLKEEKEMGDIFICSGQVKRQAKKIGISFEEELARMLTHGILHLVGYNHEKKHFDLQEKIVRKLL